MLYTAMWANLLYSALLTQEWGQVVLFKSGKN